MKQEVLLRKHKQEGRGFHIERKQELEAKGKCFRIEKKQKQGAEGSKKDNF